MTQPCCPECGGDFWPSDLKDGRKSCSSCQKKKRAVHYVSDRYLNQAFTTEWGKELVRKLGAFLEEQDIRFETRGRMLPKAAAIFQEAEHCFKGPEWIERAWLEEAIERTGMTLYPTFFRAFLIQEQILGETSQDEKIWLSIQTRIGKLPQGYRRALEVYFNERLAFRERQVRLNAKRPLTLRTLLCDLDVFSRLVRWLAASLPQLSGWDMVQEEHIHLFLLTLSLKVRELDRQRLYRFFRLAHKRRLVAHIPLLNLPRRDLPRTIEPLSLEEQKAVARMIRENLFTRPEEAWLSALCFYHGLSSSQICRLKTEQVDVERGLISIEGFAGVSLVYPHFFSCEERAPG